MIGLVLGRPFDFKDARDRIGIERIRAQSVDRFGRKRDQLSAAN